MKKNSIPYGLSLKRIGILACSFLLSCGRVGDVLPATELGFGEFVLGGSFTECYAQAENSNRFEGLNHRQEELLSHAEFISTEIPNYDNPNGSFSVLLGAIDSYQDTIYSIKYLSYRIDAIVDMYQAKYGVIEPTKNDYVDGDYHVFVTRRGWKFENGRISLIERKSEPKSLLSTLNTRHELTVHYWDNRLEEVAREYRIHLDAQKDSLKQIEQNRIKEQQEEQKQKEAKEKEQKQKEILDTFRF